MTVSTHAIKAYAGKAHAGNFEPAFIGAAFTMAMIAQTMKGLLS